jgi:hypothetical protein
MGFGDQIIQSARDFGSNYRNANAEIKHAQSQLAILQSTLKDVSLQPNSKCSASQSSFEAINESFPNGLQSNSKKARFHWAAKHRGQVSGLVKQLKETEISATFALQLEQS